MGELKRHKAQVRDKRHKGTETQREIQSGAARLSTRSTKSTKSTEALKKAAVKLAGGLGIQGTEGTKGTGVTEGTPPPVFCH